MSHHHHKPNLGIGIIGGGFIARFHIKSFIGVRDADILGIFDPDAKRAREACALAKSLGVGEARPYSSITAMAADPAIGALWICAPNYTRGEVMEEIAAAVVSGKAELSGVACEKPLGRNAGEAVKTIDWTKTFLVPTALTILCLIIFLAFFREKKAAGEAVR